MRAIARCGLHEHKKMLNILKRMIKKYPVLSGYSKQLMELEKEAKSIKDKDDKYEKLVFGEKIFRASYPIIDYVWAHEKKKKKYISKNSYRYFARLLLQLKSMAAWRDKKENFVPYNREDKECLNAMVFFVLLENNKNTNGQEYNSGVCVAYILKRIMRSAYLGDSSPENKEWYTFEVDGYEEARKRYVLEETLKEMPFVLVSRIFSLASNLSATEEALFKKAQGIVNYLEYDHIMKFLLPNEAVETKKRLDKIWDKNIPDPLFPVELYELFGIVSFKERNMIRWQKYNRSVDCNLCGHMLESAVWNWMIAFEKEDELDDPDVEAPTLFWIGIFHDMPEVYTGDMDSPLKDGIVFQNKVTLRKATEKHERYVLQEFFYPNFSKKFKEYFEEEISLESLKKELYHKLTKYADYFSADWELIYNIHNGSRSAKFVKIIKTSIKKNRTPKTTAVLKEMMFLIEHKKFFDI